MAYDRHNPIHIAIVTVALFGSLITIGCMALVLKDSRGRFRIATLLILTTAIAVLVVVIRVLLLIPF